MVLNMPECASMHPDLEDKNTYDRGFLRRKSG